ncbi:hypothetical protein D7X55_01125 [Corallococcus sp. AB049A]|uniref:hypothetical protein n=1 Tax=Corallococcus sp. AB049A TaxID=2316721 RepID=UPI000EDD1E50|nr:hypothetical protein [Corallococcus sp. AB049A]RKI74934.1 hypothetical protein D7X55_01125 [Corallococcus sp. AB049A]
MPLLRELVVDAKVPFSALEPGMVVLPPDAQSEVLGAIRTRYQADGETRWDMVAFLIRMAHPAAIPVLQELMSRTSEGLRNEMQWGVFLLQTPEVCRLWLKGKEFSQSGQDWWCRYRCPGRQPKIDTKAQGGCPDTTPLPPGNRN